MLSITPAVKSDISEWLARRGALWYNRRQREERTMDLAKYRAMAEETVAKMTIEEAASRLSFESAAIERLGIPAYNWWNEALHGVARAGSATVFPQAIALAATFDAPLVEKIADAIADEGRAKYGKFQQEGDRAIYKGLTYWSPNVNIFRDLRVTVKNVGKRDGETVLQVYRKIDHPLAERNCRLVGFRRVALRAGEEKKVRIPLSHRLRVLFEENGTRVRFDGAVTLRIGDGTGASRLELQI